MPTDQAVSHGIKTTAGVVTSAAVVMVAVFGTFATLSLVFFKELGVGLGVAVLIDATVVRAVLLPASMKLLGDWNWYLPSWLEWLPHVGPGGDPSLPPAIDHPTSSPPNWPLSRRAELTRAVLGRGCQSPVGAGEISPRPATCRFAGSVASQRSASTCSRVRQPMIAARCSFWKCGSSSKARVGSAAARALR